MDPEGTTTEAASSTEASQTVRPDSVAESVKNAIQQVKGSGAAKESAARQDQGKGAAADTAEETETKGQGEGEDAAAAQAQSADEGKPVPYTREEILKRPLWDLDLKRVPEDLREKIGPLKKRITRDFQLIADEKRALEGNTGRKAHKEQTDTTSRTDDGTKDLNRDQLYDMAMQSPEGLEQAFDAMLKQRFPQLFEERTREDRTRQFLRQILQH